MHSSPHPNQIRSACERCRRQKLRCSRPTAPEASCVRCTRLSLPCLSGSQRRVGRPSRRELVQRKPSGIEAAGVGATPAVEGSSTVDDIQFLDGMFDDTVSGMGWTMATGSPLSFASPGILLPLDPFPVPKDTPPSPCSQLSKTANIHFETLSRLNMQIHKNYDSMEQFIVTQKFEDFICMEFDALNGYDTIKLVVKNAQEFLVLIKALHRQMGVRAAPKPQSRDQLALTMDPELFGLPTPTPGENKQGDEDALPSLDSPTMFLVISCYVQLIKHLELIFNLIHSRISDTTVESPHPAPMSFADVPILEASTQFVLFCELIAHLFGQINSVLGLPSPWTGRSVWTGLLNRRRYREMVNAELGSVEDGGWTGRPGWLMEKTRVTKELLIECSMMDG